MQWESPTEALARFEAAAVSGAVRLQHTALPQPWQKQHSQSPHPKTEGCEMDPGGDLEDSEPAAAGLQITEVGCLGTDELLDFTNSFGHTAQILSN